ncbi:MULTISPECIES: efflux RND transporter periplasmic adaptor subunit [Lysobacter]|uniref:efflux RND transporter periplasmic adaptor subunit n=1 Tax=Lysobacter TaxID=68 RepID=UPI001F24AD72|nr:MULTISPECIES: efflux RND transporter periplasmic adaptor subunit [Lysobacter]UJB21505.1 efflux RND transporter periplasmic adaptor subunit [Lysobacter capsici]UJQ29378.1 efflux RND transporter periplasmic adaptor subunit [Lysobacter gummosus]
MSRFSKIALIAAVVVVMGVATMGVLHTSSADAGPGAQAGAEAAPIPVTVEPVSRQDVPVYLLAQGTVQARNSVAVNPQIGGQQLLSINFKEGQEVKKGALLAQLDPRNAQANYDQAIAKLRQDQAALATARSNYQRSSDPKYSLYVSKIDLDTQRNAVSQNEAQIAADQAAIQNAKVQMDYTRIVSPIDGVAGIRGVDPGNVVTTSTNIVTITQVRPIYVSFTLPEQNLDLVRSAARGAAALEVDALDRVDAHTVAQGGTLDVIDNTVDSATGTFKLRSVFVNEQGALWPGQFVNVRLKLRTVAGGLVIPAQAVQRSPDGDYVYLLQADQTVKMQPVKLAGEVGESHVMVVSGLAAGARIVTEGQFRLKPGSKVKPLKPGEVAAAPAAPIAAAH